jgi:tetratricopeptide (TPR) repeat protein
MLRDRELIERGAWLWMQAGVDKHPGLGYNLSNAHLDLWDLAVAEHGFVVAIQDHRHHLHTARELLFAAAADEQVPQDTRVQALTNLGNSYDNLGRDADAIAAYDQALALDPGFGMALGNKALTLLGVAPLARQHVPALLSEAVDAFDAAIEDRDRVIRIGGLSALEHFEAGRARIKVSDAEPSNKPGHVHRPGFRYSDWQDPYLRWCARHGLFLHVSLGCLSESYEELDPLFFEGVTVGLSDGEQRRVKDLVDAFNAVKQDLMAARYLLWLASGDESPIREHAAATSQRAGFLDSLMYARWGVRTGIAARRSRQPPTCWTRSRAWCTCTTAPAARRPRCRSVICGIDAPRRTSRTSWTPN